MLARSPARARTACCCARTSTPSRSTTRSSRWSRRASGRTRARRSSAPTTRRRSRCCSASRAARCASARPCRRAAVHGLRGERAGRGEGLRRAAPLRSRFGYVFDHASPIGEIVMASPTYYRIDAEFRGTPAHAGIRPEDGRSAIAAAATASPACRWGALDAQTTANVGSIAGGGPSTNVVPDRCRLAAEARSLDGERVEEVVASELVDRLHDGANAAECDVDVDVARLFARLPPPPRRPAGRGRRGGAARVRHRAGPDRHRRRLGRQRARGDGLSLHQPRQRDRGATTSPTSASAWRRSSRCSTSPSRSWTPRRSRSDAQAAARDASSTPATALVVEVGRRAARRRGPTRRSSGRCEVGDEVVVNVQARDLALGLGRLRRRARQPDAGPRPATASTART